MDLISDLSPASLLLWGTSIVLVVLYVVKNFILGGTKSSQIVPDKVKPEAVDDPSKPKLFILFGSQTGTAEGFSKVLAQEAGDIGFNVQMLNLADIMSPEQELAEMPFVIFVAATYGEGEPTDDARDFYEWLGNSSLSNDVLSGTKFTVFSLGNKQYKHYQAVGRLIDKRIEELGAQRIYKRGEGNADENIEEDFEDWKATLWTDVAKEFGLNPDFEKPIVKQYEITYFDKVNVKLCPFIDEAKGTGEDAKRPFLCKISECRELLKGQDPNDKTMRSTVHVEVDITGSKMRYEAGDHIGVFAHNPAELVQQYVERLGVANKMDTAFILKHINGTSGSVFPNRCTMRTAFTYYLELGAAPRKPLLRAFAKYATDEKERERLEVLAKNDDEGKQEYHQYIKVNYLTPLDVLLDFPSVHIPVEHFFELVPRLQPRYYSIGSSSKMHPHSIHIVASVVKYQTPKGKVRTGLCSSFLAQSKPGDRIYAFVRSSTFHLPLNTQIPVVMVGPGTGIAPFIGFLQQRRALKEKQNKVLGDAHLFFGCRKRLEDYVYNDVMQESLESGVISHLHVAFSREQAQKDYVQHHLERNAEAVWKVISSGGCFYVCGDAKFMSKDVDKALLSIVQKFNNCGVEEAEAYLEKLLQDKKLFRDVWSPSA